MPKGREYVHPYIPNSVQETRDEMLKEIGVKDVEELLTVIPKKLRFNRTLKLPKRAHVKHIRKKKLMVGLRLLIQYARRYTRI